MAEPAIKYPDFADNYLPANYEIYYDVQKTTIVVNQIVVNLCYFSVDETSAGNISPELIGHGDETNTTLSRWGDIGEIDMLIANTLKNGIRVPEIPKVKNYLFDFPELIEILPSVCKVTREKFPLGKAQLSLELDRDIEGQDEQLVLFVRQDHYEGNILEIIDEIRSKYSDSLVGKKAWFIVMTDFASPE